MQITSQSVLSFAVMVFSIAVCRISASLTFERNSARQRIAYRLQELNALKQLIRPTNLICEQSGPQF